VGSFLRGETRVELESRGELEVAFVKGRSPALVMRRDDVDIEDTVIELDGGWKADHIVEYLQEKLGDADTVDPARAKARAAAAAKARKRTKAKPKSKKAETKLAGGAEL